LAAILNFGSHFEFPMAAISHFRPSPKRTSFFAWIKRRRLPNFTTIGLCLQKLLQKQGNSKWLPWRPFFLHHKFQKVNCLAAFDLRKACCKFGANWPVCLKDIAQKNVLVDFGGHFEFRQL
jgi:hypothetical protein